MNFDITSFILGMTLGTLAIMILYYLLIIIAFSNWNTRGFRRLLWFMRDEGELFKRGEQYKNLEWYQEGKNRNDG